MKPHVLVMTCVFAAATLTACVPAHRAEDPQPMLVQLPVFKGDARLLPPTWDGRNRPHESQSVAAKRLAILTDYMTGSFDSGAQAAEDDTYYDIRLYMTRIWRDRLDGSWLYVEQAMATTLDKPYRQRVYRVTSVDDSTFKSEVFELPGFALDYAGAWKDVAKLTDVPVDLLKPRTGCEIILTWKPGEAAASTPGQTTSPSFSGSTREKTCSSDLRGASYATSEVTITSDTLLSWDRGFDAAGKQVWGATKGGYRFVKQPTK